MESTPLGEELKCAICLSLYTEPVVLACGHNFCLNCIKTALAMQKGGGVYTCPECRATYRESPVMTKNRKLCNIVEHFRDAQAVEEATVLCTYCSDTLVTAIKICLQCESAFCAMHLQQHLLQSADHHLVDPIPSFAMRKCPIHKEVLKYYCCVEGVCICMSCWVAGGHVGHKTELLSDAAKKKRRELGSYSETLDFEVLAIKRKVHQLHNRNMEERGKAAALSEKISNMFQESRRFLGLIGNLMDEAESSIRGEISRQEEGMSQSMWCFSRDLEARKNELLRAKTEIKELCASTDPLTILLKKFDSDLLENGDTLAHVPGLDEGAVTQMVKRKLLDLSNIVMDLNTKLHFLQMMKTEVLLDTSTAHHHIIISPDLRTATYTDVKQERPESLERFKTCQVISVQSFSSGKHFWEVDVSGAKEWQIGVAAHSIPRKAQGRDSFIGYNDKSWALAAKDVLQAWHNNRWTEIRGQAPFPSVGIHLDYEAGQLSFHQLSNPPRVLHTFNAKFTEPLHAAFYVFKKTCLQII
ncbi:E3 ubiquitin/ISG15 ligase TRIM25-like [Hyperolius riggenbachi]|uniref:E3 ubiquitin/ISG15 ligase TRIM25-like n=1 Tax=Hyperolius riggenbachi TaxID=752182 RepID=UPI0035A2F423